MPQYNRTVFQYWEAGSKKINIQPHTNAFLLTFSLPNLEDSTVDQFLPLKNHLAFFVQDKLLMAFHPSSKTLPASDSQLPTS